MKKLLLLCMCSLSYATMAQITSTYSPPVGCPNTTHDVSVSVTNNSANAVPANAIYTISIYIKTSAPVTTLKSYSVPGSGAYAIGETRTFILEDVPFVGSMNCTVEGSISGTINTWMGPPMNMMMMIPFAYAIPTQTYVVAGPGNLMITNTGNDLSVVTVPSNTTIRYYLNADYNTVVNESSNGNYTVVNNGSYTAKAYDASYSCHSEFASNTIVVGPVAGVLDAKGLQVSVYPNPVTSSVTVQTVSTSPLSYELSEMNGQQVRSGSFITTGSIPMEDLKAGSYVLVLKDQQDKIASYVLVK